MERYLAVDSGKKDTKLALLSDDHESVFKFSFRTMLDKGTFLDDALERNTFIAEIDGKTYKIGNGATRSATLETTKMSEIHKISTLCAIALCVNNGDNVHVAIGCPIKDYEIVENRIQYKNFILPDGEVEVKIKTKSDKEPETKKFTIVTKYVYPESAGVLYLNMKKYANKTCGIVDIGSLNTNGTEYENFELLHKYSFTTEYGSTKLISGLSQELTSEFNTRCNEDYLAKVLTLPIEKRMCQFRNNDEQKALRSKEIIDDYLLEYVKDIKRACDAKNWALEFTDLTFIGGTTHMLSNEIYTVFGENVFIPKDPEFINAIGFLKRLAAKELGITITNEENEKLVI